ncbi:MAG: hypothetical protein JO143_06685, partial [Acetobacteraceae bacterium]|nr:hypothetical protein [Acetobacteraceae bacterium]
MAAAPTPSRSRRTARSSRLRCCCRRWRPCCSAPAGRHYRCASAASEVACRNSVTRPPYPDVLLPGRDYPLGASWDGRGVNFAVFSAHAERIDVCLFDASGREETGRYTLPEYTDQVWHGYLPEAGPGTVYGLRAFGP